MSERGRREALEQRRRERVPWHSPPHRNSDRTDSYLFTAACFEHRPVIGANWERMAAFEEKLLAVTHEVCTALLAWVILPNHYHFLARTPDAVGVIRALGRLHGRTSYLWNGEDGKRGRQVWFNAVETAMKSERHFWATVNYVHHNPVKHGCVEFWQEWPFSSAADYIETVGREEAERQWREYPITEYGKGWDD